ncbi:MAG: hypothetical protein AAF624_17215 [Bacteroidota bacterium]
MSVVRVKRQRERFTVLSTATLRTRALSLKARGLWALCLSYPDDWEFRIGHLQSQSEHDGRRAVQTALRELEQAGLAALETLRGEDGCLRGKRWTIYEEASLNPKARVPASTPDTDEVATDLSGDRPAENVTVGERDRRDARPTATVPQRSTEHHEASRSRTNEQHASGEATEAQPLRLIVGDAAAALRNADGDAGRGPDPTPPSASGRLQAHEGNVRHEGEVQDAAVLLQRRGVEPRVAADLARGYGTTAVQRAVQLYDERRRGPSPPSGPGWLVAALRRGYANEARPEAPLLTYAEMLRWCESNGGLHRTSEFEPHRQPDGTTLFRLSAYGRRSAPSS